MVYVLCSCLYLHILLIHDAGKMCECAGEKISVGAKGLIGESN